MHSANNYVDDNDLREIKVLLAPQRNDNLSPSIGGGNFKFQEKIAKIKSSILITISIPIIPNNSLILPFF